MNTDRLPYLDPCPRDAGAACDEYPVLTMYFMRLSGWLSGNNSARFFSVNAGLLAVLALLTSWILFRLAGSRARYFALAPTLLLYAFINWDLLAIALATGATLAFLRGRDRTSGVLLGLGTAAKLYPVLLVLPFAIERWRSGSRRGSAEIAGWAAGAWVIVNVPFVVSAFPSWATFFRMNRDRPVDYTSLWFGACHRIGGSQPCAWSPHLVDAVSLLAFVAIGEIAWWARSRTNPGFPLWTLGFPVIVAFLITNKVYSAQYSLWLLPWFALALPDLRLFVAFELTDVAVFLTQFSWFGTLLRDQGDPAFAGFAGPPLGAFELAVLARGAVLTWCLVAWIRQRAQDAPLGVDGVALEYSSKTASGTR